MNSSTSAISSGSRMSIGASPSLARTNSRICTTLGASSETAPHQGATSKPLLSLPHWYLFARYTRLRPRTPAAERVALVARKQIAGLLLADIVSNNLANRRSCCERKVSWTDERMNWCEYWVHLINGCYEVPPFLIHIIFIVQVVHKDITQVFHCRLPMNFYTIQGHLAQCCIIIRTVTNTHRLLGVKRNIEFIGKVFTDINLWL